MIKKSDVFIYYESDEGVGVSESDVFVGAVPKYISNVSDLFDVLFETLSLPGYFGFNWNALSDCLRDFHWLDERVIVLLHEDIPRLPECDLFEYLDVLRVCVTDWERDPDRKFLVMFPIGCKQEISSLLDTKE